MDTIDLIKISVQLLGYILVAGSIIIASKNLGVSKANHEHNKAIKTYEFSSGQMEHVLKAFLCIKSKIKDDRYPNIDIFYEDEDLYCNSLVLVNKFDLMAIGISKGVLEESVLKASYFTMLLNSYSILSCIIDDLRESSKNEEFGEEFRKLHVKWSSVYLPKLDNT